MKKENKTENAKRKVNYLTKLKNKEYTRKMNEMCKSRSRKKMKLYGQFPPVNHSSGKRQQLSVLRYVVRQSSFAIRNVMLENFTSGWRLFRNENILRFIRMYTEAKAHRCLYPHWNVPLDESDFFISLMYAGEAFIPKGIAIKKLQSTTQEINFPKQTMTRDRFKEIIGFLRFDLKAARSERLPTDSLAVEPKIWNSFIENCLFCYKIGNIIMVYE